MMEDRDNWVFYLKLSKNLPRQYFAMDQEFKKAQINLVPVSLSDLLQILKTENRPQVICMVQSFTHFKVFQRQCQKVLNMLVRNDLIDLYVLSSFTCFNQTANFKGRRNYVFLSLPVPLRQCCAMIAASIINRWRFGQSWIGGTSGKRPKILGESIE